MKSIGLCMIVKNEAQTIRACIESALPLIDFALITDTGSNDGTLSVAHNILNEHKLDGLLTGQPWRNFAHNRNQALAKMREPHLGLDYALIMDADDRLVFEPDFDAKAFKESLTCDAYEVKITYGTIEFWRPQLISNLKEFSYKGVLHEYLDMPEDAETMGRVEEFHIQANATAKPRSPTKYRDDAKLLEEALAKEKDPFLISRYTFYLAQSHRDAGNFLEALRAYQRRSEMGLWEEEVYVSLIEAGKIMELLNLPLEGALALYERAIATVPTRAEAFHAAAHLCRKQEKFDEAVKYAERGLRIWRPDEGLFIQPWIYNYGLLDEFSISAYYVGDYPASLNACIELLKKDIPPEYVRRIATNAEFAVKAIWKS